MKDIFLTDKTVLPFNLQFFAENAENENAENEGDIGTGDDSTGEETETKDEKKFTQAQVTAMMAREKKEGRRALLNALGFKTEKEAQAAVKLYTALVNSQKSEEEKGKDRENSLSDELSEFEKRAQAAEDKLACLTAGVDKDSLEDVMAVARLKITDDKPLETVLIEMKKQPRYASFFSKNDETGGDTGRDPGHGRKEKDEKKGAYGARLAASPVKKEKKASFFD